MLKQLNSCIYKVNIMHQRLLPQKHKFDYEFFMFMLDLDEAAEINRRLKLAKVNKHALYSFDDADHFQLTPVATRDKLTAFLASKGIEQEIGRVLLVTNFRFLGYVFNPISVLFVHDKQGAPLVAVAEVGNTFLERKPFLLPRSHDVQKVCTKFTLTAPKNFYVSPFSKVDETFEFVCNLPNQELEIHINTRAGQQTTLVSSLHGRKIELTDANILLCTLRYPFVTLAVILLIHFHALLLWLKRVPFFRKEEQTQLQTDLINPHRSLKNISNSTEKINIHAYEGTAQ